MLTQAIGIVSEIVEQSQDMQLLSVQSEGSVRQAIAYSALVGLAEVSDQVLLNTTARELKLGTGGYDFVIANLSHPLSDHGGLGGGGHIVPSASMLGFGACFDSLVVLCAPTAIRSTAQAINTPLGNRNQRDKL